MPVRKFPEEMSHIQPADVILAHDLSICNKLDVARNLR